MAVKEERFSGPPVKDIVQYVCVIFQNMGTRTHPSTLAGRSFKNSDPEENHQKQYTYQSSVSSYKKITQNSNKLLVN